MILTLLTAGAAAATAAAPSLSEMWQLALGDFANITEASRLTAFGQVLLIDIVLAGDNAIVVGALAAGLPDEQRKKVILIGIIAALVLRIGFALIATWLLGIVGLIFAGGLLLLWVAWKMWRELHHSRPTEDGVENIRPARSFASAAWAVALADVSMSLDNVLAVAGAAREHPGILIIGLVLSVALMGLAANLIARYIERYRWIAYVGLVVILYVAGKMIYDGAIDPKIGITTLFA